MEAKLVRMTRAGWENFRTTELAAHDGTYIVIEKDGALYSKENKRLKSGGITNKLIPHIACFYVINKQVDVRLFQVGVSFSAAMRAILQNEQFNKNSAYLYFVGFELKETREIRRAVRAKLYDDATRLTEELLRKIQLSAAELGTTTKAVH